MQIEIAEHGRMSESGSSLLRLIQNNGTSCLDLLVRESVQNCLDAGDGKSSSVRVDFNTGSFNTEDVSPLFEGIEDSLDTRYPGKQSFISVRDTHTCGLTGPVRYADVRDGNFGNLLKLVYEISKPQDQSGAGGSWGLGKTVYFRIGAGLVIYYSRIRKEGPAGGYESRLAAALVEDEGRENHLLPQTGNISRGIAWWGSPDGDNRTVPLTDEDEINGILYSFGISAYDGEQTGTTIIIPFIDEKRLLEETEPFENEEDSARQVPYWCRKRIADYLKISIQRWYAPRLDNAGYNGQYLEAYINGEKLAAEDMAPVFQLIQVLYNSTPEYRGSFNGKTVSSKPVDLRRTFARGSGRAGYINYIRVTYEDMKMIPPDNCYNPYYYIDKDSTDPAYNDPIILYTRKPGMVVSYSTTGDWTERIPKTETGEYIIGLFIANSDNRLEQKDMLLDDYLRRGEKADHMAWDDWPIDGKNPQIVSRIRKNLRKKIRDDYMTPVKTGNKVKNLGLGKAMADFLMPPIGFSNWDEAQGGGAGPGGTGGTGTTDNDAQGSQRGEGFTGRYHHITFSQTGPASFTGEGINLPLRISFGDRSVAVLEMCVNSECNSLSGREWEKNLGSAFPIGLKGFTLESVTRGSSREKTNLLAGPAYVEAGSSLGRCGISISFEPTETFGVRNVLRISTDNTDNTIVDGILTYGIRGGVQGSVVLKGEK